MNFLVQSAHSNGTGFCDFPQNVAIGDMLVVLAKVDSASALLSCSDTFGNVYLPLTPRQNPASTITSQLFLSISVVAGLNRVTINNTGAGGLPVVAIHEFATVIAIDGDVFATGAGNAQDSGQITTTQPYEILFGYEAGNSVLGQVSVAAGVGWIAMETSPIDFLTQYMVQPNPGKFNSTTSTTSSKGGTCSWVEEVVALFNPNIQVGEVHKNNIAYPPAKQPGGLGTPVTDPKQQLGSPSPLKPDVLFPMNEYTGRFRAGCGHSFNNFEVLKEGIQGVPSAIIVCPLCKYVARIVTPYDLIHDNVAFAQIIG